MKKQNKKKCQTAGPIWRPLLRTIFWASHNRRGELLVFYYFFMGTWFTLTVLSVLLRVFFSYFYPLHARESVSGASGKKFWILLIKWTPLMQCVILKQNKKLQNLFVSGKTTSVWAKFFILDDVVQKVDFLIIS